MKEISKEGSRIWFSQVFCFFIFIPYRTRATARIIYPIDFPTRLLQRTSSPSQLFPRTDPPLRLQIPYIPTSCLLPSPQYLYFRLDQPPKFTLPTEPDLFSLTASVRLSVKPEQGVRRVQWRESLTCRESAYRVREYPVEKQGKSVVDGELWVDYAKGS